MVLITNNPATQVVSDSNTEEITVRMADLVVTALSVVFGLSLNEAIQTLFVPGGLFGKYSKYGPWITMLVILAVAIAFGFWRARLVAPPPPTKVQVVN
jgi:hypothetical protein